MTTVIIFSASISFLALESASLCCFTCVVSEKY